MRRCSLFVVIVLGFSAAVTRAADKEKLTVVDYFLLLPEKTFEAPAKAWLQNAEIDKQNGYMEVSGNGAQPSFQIALFRYRDSRPLLAIYSGALEGDDSVALEFYQLGTDGKMHKAPRKIFPIGDQGSSGEYEAKCEDFRFELPRRGRTILVRSAKSKKILHKVMWNGEQFRKENR